VPSNHSTVCTLIRDTPKGLANCIYSGKQLGRKAREILAPIRQCCYSIGFTDAAAPIIVNGRHIANWLIGQFQIGKVDEPRVREYAKEIGTDPDEMVRAFQTMPKLTMEQLDNKLSFLGVMANELSLMGYQNLLQRLQAEELHKIREQLEGSQEHLEQLVLTRTADLQQANRQLTQEMAEKNRIQRQQNRLVTAIESAAESIVITSPTGKIIYVNPAFSELTGYSTAELLGNSPRLIKSGYHDDQFYRHLWQTITAGQTWVGRFVNRKKDGTIRYRFDIRKLYRRDPGNRPSGRSNRLGIPVAGN
jgi:PAS domain S-box-containing protein